MKVAFVSVLPSPYQRDLFAAIAARPEIDLSVFYMERAAPDSPWPEKPLASYERYMPGFWFGLGKARIHMNRGLPQVADYDVTVINTLTVSITGQWLMRAKLRGRKWMFFGEKLGPRSRKQEVLTAPLNRSSGIAAIGSWAEQDYAARFPGVPVFNIPYHCDLAPFFTAPRPPRQPGTVTYLFCGQMIARKGLDHVLAAFAKLPENARLLLVGREAELPQMLAPMPDSVRQRIHYAGFQSPDALPQFFAQADVFILPSRYDGWGVVVNQALGAGLPVICSDQVGAGRDLVTDGENGYIFRVGDIDSLAAKMAHFTKDETLAACQGAASRKRAEDWTPARGAERWLAALKAITA
jgi:glycosyltransferase involved in cell wall biosynthesis